MGGLALGGMPLTTRLLAWFVGLVFGGEVQGHPTPRPNDETQRRAPAPMLASRSHPLAAPRRGNRRVFASAVEQKCTDQVGVLRKFLSGGRAKVNRAVGGTAQVFVGERAKANRPVGGTDRVFVRPTDKT